MQSDKGPMPGKLVFTPINIYTFYFYDKRKELDTDNLIKDKRCEKIKGRTCAYGSKKTVP